MQCKLQQDKAKKEQAQREAEWKQKSYDEKIELLKRSRRTKDITKQAEDSRKKVI